MSCGSYRQLFSVEGGAANGVAPHFSRQLHRWQHCYWWLVAGFDAPSPVPLAGASVSVVVPFVAVAAAGVSPSFPGESDDNAAPAEAVRAMMIALCCVEMIAFAFVWFAYVDTGRYVLRGFILSDERWLTLATCFT